MKGAKKLIYSEIHCDGLNQTAKGKSRRYLYFKLV